MATFYIVHFYIKEGREEDFKAYQNRALSMLRWQEGEIIAAFKPVKPAADETPDEIHVLKFPSVEKYHSYVLDQERAAGKGQLTDILEKKSAYLSESEILYENTFATVVSSGLKEAFQMEQAARARGTETPDQTPTLIIPPKADSKHPAQRPQIIDTFISDTRNPAQRKLARLVLDWQESHDKRVVFAHTYLMMTTNMLKALEHGEYQDNAWVRQLLERFAYYYLDALKLYEQAWYSAPPVWRVAFQVAENPESMTAQNLLLGVNAHINHDLVLTLVDLLEKEWPSLSPAQKRIRYEDHTYVNQVIARTMEATQQEIINRYSPVLDALNKVSFNMDFIVISRLIGQWREQVWKHAAQYLDLEDRDERHSMLQKVEYIALCKADVIMLKQGPFKMKGLL